MSVRIIDSLPELGGQLTALYPEKLVYDMPGFPAVLAKDLAGFLVEQAARFNPEVVLEETVTGLTAQGDDWLLTTATGKQFATRTIMISAGAGAFSPTKLGVDREEHLHGKGIHYGVRSLEAFRDSKVLVVGGGDSAFDWALALHGIASQVKLVHRRDQFRAHEDTVEQVRSKGVEFHLWQSVKALHGEDSLQGVTLENTQTKETTQHEADHVRWEVVPRRSICNRPARTA